MSEVGPVMLVSWLDSSDPNTQYFSRFHVISDNFVNIQPIKL